MSRVKHVGCRRGWPPVVFPLSAQSLPIYARPLSKYAKSLDFERRRALTTDQPRGIKCCLSLVYSLRSFTMRKFAAGLLVALFTVVFAAPAFAKTETIT